MIVIIIYFDKEEIQQPSTSQVQSQDSLSGLKTSPEAQHVSVLIPPTQRQ